MRRGLSTIHRTVLLTALMIFLAIPNSYAAECSIDEDCNDFNPCTLNTCNAGACNETDVDDGTTCDVDPGLDEVCDGGQCVEACLFDSQCLDSFACTQDTCNTGLGICEHAPSDAACDNSTFCDGAELCRPDDAGADSRGCIDGEEPTCDDGFDCTFDYCDTLESDDCEHLPNDSLCNDLLFCNGAESCNPSDSAHDDLGCIDGTAPDCADTIPCTDDSCDEENKRCDNQPNDSLCDDGNSCTNPDACTPAAPGANENGCTTQTLPTGQVCLLDNSQDGYCIDGICQDACITSDDCEDGFACTTGVCNEETFLCEYVPNDSVCDNDILCDGTEICSPETVGADPDGCITTAVDCNDGVSCTVDTCNVGLDECEHTPDDTLCDDSAFCNGVETCHETLDCLPGTDPCEDPYTCTIDSCDEENDTCSNIPDDSVCDDGQACNGLETCAPGSRTNVTDGCAPGTPIVCDDGVDCTDDSCVDPAGTCDATPNDANCSDSNPCTSGTCDTENDCQFASRPDGTSCDLTPGVVETCLDGQCVTGCSTNADCDDSVYCTQDQCNPVTHLCNHTPLNYLCSDGNQCNGVESCDPDGQDPNEWGCVAGTELDCDDDIACTVDTCDTFEGCQNTPSDQRCDDENVCNGSETCNSDDPSSDENGCVAGVSLVCNDEVGCTEDDCHPIDGCYATPVDAACDDSVACTVDVCDAQNDCQNTPDNAACDDSVACTVDVCDAVNDCQNTPDNTACDDSVDCTVDTCDAQNDCQNTPDNAACDDSVACTVDVCDAVNDCQNTPDNTACDDSVDCTVDTCDAQNDCQNTPDDTACDDSIACTVDVCDAQNDCQNTPDDTACDDSVDCTLDTCDAQNDCQNTPDDGICDDGFSCTIDVCDAQSDCQNTPDDTVCDDSLACNGIEVCDPGSGKIVADGCVSGTPVDCADGVGCTLDTCTENNGEALCVNEPDDSACRDEFWCNGIETCDVLNDCQPGQDVDCSDGVDCTDDTCNDSTDSCDNTPSDENCPDPGPCRTLIGCDAQAGCLTEDRPDRTVCDIEPGIDEICDTGECVPRCSDNEDCEGEKVCDDGLCVTPCDGAEDCNDDIACTVDACTDGQCSHTPSNPLCGDAVFCNGDEICQPSNLSADSNGCIPGPLRSCNDDLDCTQDSCDTTEDICVHDPVHSRCANDRYCDGVEVCDPEDNEADEQGCAPGVPVVCDDLIACTTDRCDSELDQCVFDPSDLACDDGLYCSGVETCDPTNPSAGADGCLQGDVVVCSDGIACTHDVCDEGSKDCRFDPVDLNCADSSFCNGDEICDPEDIDADAQGCLPGVSPCTDDFACTVNTCDEPNDQCIVTPDDSLCADTLYCNGVELCRPAELSADGAGCIVGTPPDCSDSYTCTQDDCDEEGDTCTHTPSDAACADTLFCNGIETCNPSDVNADNNGCVPGDDPCEDEASCTLDECIEISDECVNTPMSDRCSDGQYCNGAERCAPDDSNADAAGCIGGSDPCDDEIPCTTDNCNETDDQCSHQPDHAFCDDNSFCNGEERCSLTDGCYRLDPPICDDELDCTEDSCDDNAGDCVFTPDDEACDNGDPCSTSTCDVSTGCVDEFEADDTVCDVDPQLVESCQNGICVPDCIQNEDCDDEAACTTDTCDAQGHCQYELDDAACNDGVAFCDPIYTCEPFLGCVAGDPPDCRDDFACTIDSCDTTEQACMHTPDDDACNDFNACTTDTCSATEGCVTTPVPDDTPCSTGYVCRNGECVPPDVDGDIDGDEEADLPDGDQDDDDDLLTDGDNEAEQDADDEPDGDIDDDLIDQSDDDRTDDDTAEEDGADGDTDDDTLEAADGDRSLIDGDLDFDLADSELDLDLEGCDCNHSGTLATEAWLFTMMMGLLWGWRRKA